MQNIASSHFPQLISTDENDHDQAVLLERYTPHDLEKKMIIRTEESIDGKIKQFFWVIDRFTDLEDFLFHCPGTTSFHEVILGERKVRVFFDINVKPEHLKAGETLQGLAHLAIDWVITSTMKLCPTARLDRDFAIFRSVAPGIDEERYHIIMPYCSCPDVEMMKYLFKTMKACHPCEELFNREKQVLEEGVYGGNGSLRIAATYMPIFPYMGQLVKRQPAYPTNLPSEWYHLWDFSESVLGYYGQGWLPLVEFPRVTMPELKKCASGCVGSTAMATALTALVAKFGGAIPYDHKIEGVKIRLHRTRADQCPLCESVHEKEHALIFMGKWMKFYCFCKKGKEHALSLGLNPDWKEKEEEEESTEPQSPSRLLELAWYHFVEKHQRLWGINPQYTPIPVPGIELVMQVHPTAPFCGVCGQQAYHHPTWLFAEHNLIQCSAGQWYYLKEPELEIVINEEKELSSNASTSSEGQDRLPYFDPVEEYYWPHFYEWFSHRKYVGTEEGGFKAVDVKEILWQLSRVCRVFPKGDGLYGLFKEDAENGTFSYYKILKQHESLVCNLTWVDKENETHSEDVSINKFLVSNNQQIISYTMTYIPYHIDDKPMLDYRHMSTFPGFMAQKVELTFDDLLKIKLILTHVFVCMADSNLEYFKWIMSWIAHPIRFLKKANKTLAVVGEQGCGKTTVFDFLQQCVYGFYLLYKYDDLRRLDSQFNGELLKPMVVNIEETCDQGTGKVPVHVWTRIKGYITGDQIPIRQMRHDTYFIKNIISWSLTSNHDHGIVIEADDRRYGIFRASNKFTRDFTYFTKLRKTFTPEVGNIFYSFLRSPQFESFTMELGDVKFVNENLLVNLENIPETPLKAQLRRTSRLPIMDFFDDLSTGLIRLSTLDLDNVDNKLFIQSPTIYAVYVKWCSKVNCKPFGQSRFSSQLYNYFDVPAEERGNNNRVKIGETWHRGFFLQNKFHSHMMVDCFNNRTLQIDPISIEEWVQGGCKKPTNPM